MSRLRMSLLLVLLVSGAASAEVLDASVCGVLADPASFDGKMVRLKGATVVAGLDEFALKDARCAAAGAIWLSYPEGTKAKAGPLALVRLQLAKNGPAAGDAPKRAAVTLDSNNKDFKQLDGLMSASYKSSGLCLGCAKYTVDATLVGRLDGVRAAGLVRDKAGKVSRIDGFGNMNLYRARLVLQSVSEVSPREIDYSPGAIAVRGDSRHATQRATNSDVKRASAAFGAPGEGNGVIVGFGVPNEVPPDEGTNGKGDSPDGILYYATYDSQRLGPKLLPKAITHVGTHIADLREAARMQTLDEAETRAWQTTFTE